MSSVQDRISAMKRGNAVAPASQAQKNTSSVGERLSLALTDNRAVTIDESKKGTYQPRTQTAAAKENENPTFFERVGNTVSGIKDRQLAGYAGAAEFALEGLQWMDKQASEYPQKAKKAEEDIQRYQAMLRRGTFDNGQKLTLADRERIAGFVRDAQKNLQLYQEALVNIQKPMSNVISSVDTFGDERAQKAEESIAKAKEGAGVVGQVAVDLGVAAGDLAGDALLNYFLPGVGTATRATRTFGHGAELAEDKDAGLGKQMLYGAGAAALGELTNRAFNNSSILKTAYGQGFMDDALTAGMKATKLGNIVATGAEEAMEETAENMGTQFLQSLLFGEKADQISVGDAAYDALIAALIGSATSALSPSPRKGTQGSSATIPAVSEGSNAPEIKTPQNGSKSDSAGKNYLSAYDPMEAAAIQRVGKTFKNIVAGVDTSIADFFNKWKGGRKSHQGEILEKLYIGKVTDAARAKLSDLLGYDVKSKDYIITADNVKHITDQHGNDAKEIQRGNLPLSSISMNDLADVVSNPDRIVLGDSENWEAGRQGVQFEKNIGNGTVVYVQFDNFKRGTIEPRTLYIKKEVPTSAVNTANAASTYTPKTTEPETSDSMVAQPTEVVKTNDGVGAADAGFDPYSQLQNQSSQFHPEGANAARPVDMPTTDLENRNIPKSASTVMGAQATPDQSVIQLGEMVARGELSFDTITDSDSVSRAQATIAEKTFGGALEQYRQAVNSGVASKDNTTLGQQLLIMAMQSGNVEATAELLSLYTRNSTTAAQALQAQSIFRKLSPESQLISVQKAIDAMNQKYGTEHTIEPADMAAFLEAKSADARKEAEKEIVKKAAQAMPKTFKAKFDTLRYLAMLGNAKTHIRNILGNALFQVPVAAKNRVGAALEWGANKVSGGKVERTKSLIGANPFGAVAKDARADWANGKDFLEQSSAYRENQSLLKNIENEAHAFDDSNLVGAAINSLSDANSNLLAAEDTAAKRIIYTQSLAGYLKANGCKRIADASPELLNRARTYAANEALRNTFNDTNALSSAVSKLNSLSSSDNKVMKAAGYVVEGVLPFKKTPANILVRAEEYSPIGAGVGIFNTIRGAKSGDTTIVSKGLEQLAQGLTGTALMTLGALAAGNGWVTGKEDEDETQAGFDELTGHQSYALELNDGTSITLDWLAPEAIPFFVGVELYNAGLDGKLPPKEFFAAIKNSTAPMLEMSLLQSLNDTVENAAYAKFSGGSVLGSLVSSALTNYLSQVIPTIGGQFERANEEERMTTYTDKNGDLSTDMQYAIGKVSQKIPGWDYQQIPYIDAWGRTESTGDPLERAANNLFNPAYMSKVDVDKVESELQRLYDSVGSEYGTVFPQRAERSFVIDGETKNLTAEEYVKYAKAKGENSYKFAKQVMALPAYKQMTDSEKAELIADVYAYANYKAKRAVDSAYKHDTYDTYAEAEKQGITPAEYAAYRLTKKDIKADKDKDGKSISGSKQEKVINYIDSLNLSGPEKDWLFLLSYASDNEKTNKKKLRDLPWNK